MSRVIQNAVYLPDRGLYLISRHVHEYISFTVRGENHFIDGGSEYLRRSFNEHPEILDYSLFSNSSIEDIHEKLLWGNRGINGDQPLVYKPIAKMDLDHIKAVLSLYGKQVQPHYKETLEYWKLMKEIEESKEVISKPTWYEGVEN